MPASTGFLFGRTPAVLERISPACPLVGECQTGLADFTGASPVGYNIPSWT